MNFRPVLEVRDLWFKYPENDWVLRGVNLSVDRGEHVLVIGETGSGKTTTVRAVTRTGEIVYGGELRGEVLVAGKNVRNLELEEIFRTIHVIGQNPYLYFTEPIVKDDLLAYARRIHRMPRIAERAVVKAVESMGIHKLLERYFFELSGGEAKRVLVAKSLIGDPLIFLFDEPLMWLDDQGVRDFIELLAVLKRMGKSVLVFEHRFLPIYRYFDKIMVLKNGVLKNATELLLARTEALKTNVDVAPAAKNRLPAEGLALKAREIHHSYEDTPVLRGVSLNIEKRDLVFIYGLNGAGKTTLLKILSGYLKPKRGKVYRYVDVVYIPQNTTLFYTEETIEKEIGELCRTRKLGDKCIEEGIQKVKALGLNPNQSPFNLSHGQMVKLAVELATLSGAGILLLDEPFSGLTYQGRLLLLEHLASLNIAVVVVSSSLDAAVSSVWTKMYKLENGVLSELKVQDGYDLIYASRLYSEVLERA